MIVDELAAALAAAVAAQYQIDAPTVEVVHAQAGFGDYSSNVAFGLAKVVGQSPREIAAAIAARLEHPQLAKAEAAGAGFINMSLTGKYWRERLTNVTQTAAKPTGQKVQVEFISANPTGPLTLANARGGFLGDVIANVLSQLGHTVTREYYLNDAGGQIAKLVESAKAEAGIAIDGERQYRGAYLAELIAKVPPREYDDDAALARALVSELTRQIKLATERLGIGFDVWFSEQSLVESGATERMLEWLGAQKLVYDKDEALWLASSTYGDERDRVLIRASGEPTYLMNDLAYHYNILVERGFDRSIKLWGSDHAGQVASLKLTTAKFAPEASLEFILIQFVRLIRDGVEVKMSKRAGTYVTIDELMETLEHAVGHEHAGGVARWFFLMRSADNRLDFDLALASEASRDNPYFYVMYAYARANSILTKADERQLKPASSPGELSPAAVALVRQMDQLDELVTEVGQDFAVHKLMFYGYELARAFTEYYESARIVDLPEPQAAKELYVVQQFVNFMDRYWAVVGITPHRRMQRAED